MNNRRYYQIAGITIQVDADLPITDATFDPKFRLFEVAEPGDDVIRVHHHFELSDIKEEDLGKEVYRRPPWAIYRKDGRWVYLGILPESSDKAIWRVAIFDDKHTEGHMYGNVGEAFRKGGLGSLTLLPTDQILLARVLADRQACYLHSAGVVLNRQGLLFVGHSEAGKSTTVKMLRDRAEILCDDRNIVRRWPAGFRVHGTWSHGEVPDVSGASAPLRAVLFLEQARENRLVRIEDRRDILHRLMAFVIKSLVTVNWWDKTLPLLHDVAARVPCYVMHFDKSGAVVEALEELCAAPSRCQSSKAREIAVTL
ncbi:MAG: hypothetical protein M1570_16235 [Chloroflexi bacterium]|nr:hypothetical protein [Chloroflexota bacterium]